MPSSRRRFVAAGAGLFAGVAGCIEGQRLDGPTPTFESWVPAPNDWPLARRDTENTAANPHARPPTSDPEERRVVDAPGPVRAMVLARRTLFVSGAGGRLGTGDPVDEAGGVVAVDAETDEERWRAAAPSGSLAVRDRTLYALGRSGDLAALDAETGEERWRVDAAENRRGVAVNLTREEVLCGFDVGLRAFDRETGEEQWRIESGTCSAVADGRLYVAGGGEVATYEPREGADVVVGDGPKEVWRTNGPFRYYLGPVRHGDALYVGEDGTGIDGPTAYGASDSTERWQGPLDGIFVTAPAVAGNLGVVAVGAREGDDPPSLAALDLADGGVRWRVELDGRPRSPVVAGDIALVGGDDLRAYDVETGEERWRSEVRGPVRGVIAAADAVYAATRNGRVRAFE